MGAIQKTSYLGVVKECLLEKSAAIESLTKKLGLEVDLAIDMILSCKGRVVVSGMGKSGIIGKKIAATLASTGTSSFFVHPGEAFHGDLGMIREEDVVFLISNSGETEEVIKLIPSLKRFGNKIISIVNNSDSTLANNSDVNLDIYVAKEICPNNLAPTTSTTITLALADSIAVALMKAKNFKAEQFAVYHPGGSLGRRLLTKVKDEMVASNLPFVSLNTTFNDVVMAMTKSKLGMAIVREGNEIKGVISDGDLRRFFVSGRLPGEVTAQSIMNDNPVFISPDAMLAEAEALMKEKQIQWLLVSSKEQGVAGVLQIYS